MKESNFKGIWIPKEILLDEKLTDKEKIVLSIVISFSEDNKTCYVGNRYLSKLLNVTQNRASYKTKIMYKFRWIIMKIQII